MNDLFNFKKWGNKDIGLHLKGSFNKENFPYKEV